MVCIDAAVRLVKAAQKGMVLYKADSDGHPIAEGYRQIAYAGQEALEAMRVLEHGKTFREPKDNLPWSDRLDYSLARALRPLRLKTRAARTCPSRLRCSGVTAV